jgi:hypothetical protein
MSSCSCKGKSADRIAGQRIDVSFHGCSASGRTCGSTLAAAAVALGVLLRGENLLRGGGHAIEQQTQQHFGVEPSKDRVVAVVRKAVEVAQGCYHRSGGGPVPPEAPGPGPELRMA